MESSQPVLLSAASLVLKEEVAGTMGKAVGLGASIILKACVISQH